jgi:hypothetical protein
MTSNQYTVQWTAFSDNITTSINELYTHTGTFRIAWSSTKMYEEHYSFLPQ